MCPVWWRGTIVSNVFGAFKMAFDFIAISTATACTSTSIQESLALAAAWRVDRWRGAGGAGDRLQWRLPQSLRPYIRRPRSPCPVLHLHHHGAYGRSLSRRQQLAGVQAATVGTDSAASVTLASSPSDSASSLRPPPPRPLSSPVYPRRPPPGPNARGRRHHGSALPAAVCGGRLAGRDWHPGGRWAGALRPR